MAVFNNRAQGLSLVASFIFTATLFLIIRNVEISISKPIIILMFSFLFQEISNNLIFFNEENTQFSRNLASLEIFSIISSKLGNIFTTLLILALPFLISLSIFSILLFYFQYDIIENISNLTIYSIVLGLLIDPVIYIFFSERTINALTILFGYISILLIAIGSISEFSDSSLLILILSLALLNVRQTFIIQLNYKKETGISFLAPSIIALFIVMMPNLVTIIGVL